MIEGDGQGGRRTRRAPAAILVVLTCVLQCGLCGTAVSPPPPTERVCPLGEFLNEEKGVCCNKCPPGFKLVKECQSEHHRSQCDPCPNGQFQDFINHSNNCRSCTRCRASRHEREVSPCQRDRNTVCQCKDGFYRDDVDRLTYQCLRCKKCGANEIQKTACSPSSNTECVCKENHYRVNNQCSQCKNCSSDCSLHCSSPPPPSPPPPILTKGLDLRDGFLVNVVVGGVVVVVAFVLLVGVVTHLVTKRSAHKKLLPRQTSTQSEEPSEPCKVVLITNEDPALTNMDPLSSAPQQEVPNLPDCIPLEIKISDLIYSVLDQVPVLRVKQLVRSLGVKDSDIEQAELDHRHSREAHYQMLRVWAEQGGRGQGGRGGRSQGMLHRPLILELLEKLQEMHLGHAAEELQAKYSI